MKFSLYADTITALPADLLAVPAFEDAPDASWAYKALDKATKGQLASAISAASFTGKADSSLSVDTPSGPGARRILMVGLGPEDTFEGTDARNVTVQLARAARRCNAETVAIALPQRKGVAISRILESLAEGLFLGAYAYNTYKSDPSENPIVEARVAVPPKTNDQPSAKEARAAFKRGKDIGMAVNRARDLDNGPPNDVTPTCLANTAKEIAKKVNSLGFALVGVWVEEVAEAYADALRDRKLVCDVSEE